MIGLLHFTMELLEKRRELWKENSSADNVRLTCHKKIIMRFNTALVKFALLVESQLIWLEHPEWFATQVLWHHSTWSQVTKNSWGIPPIGWGGVGKLRAADVSLLFPPCPNDQEGFATVTIVFQWSYSYIQLQCTTGILLHYKNPLLFHDWVLP
jgi:hypothetical protein